MPWIKLLLIPRSAQGPYSPTQWYFLLCREKCCRWNIWKGYFHFKSYFYLITFLESSIHFKQLTLHNRPRNSKALQRSRWKKPQGETQRKSTVSTVVCTGGNLSFGNSSREKILCSVAKLPPTLCDSIDGSMPDFSVLHYLLKFAQTHVHWVCDAIQPFLDHNTSLFLGKPIVCVSWA